MQETAPAMLNLPFQGFEGIRSGRQDPLRRGGFQRRGLEEIIGKGIDLSGIGIPVPQVIPGKVEEPGETGLLLGLQGPGLVWRLFRGIHGNCRLYPTSLSDA
jgi:hypothetical protein